MKKILSGIIAASLVFCSAVNAFAVSSITYSSKGYVTVDSDINSDKNTKKSTVRGSSKLDITSLFIWTAVDSKIISNKRFTVTSETGRVEDGTEHPYIPVDVRIRIVNDSASKKSKYIVGETDKDGSENDGKYSVFEYFKLTVYDDTEVIYVAENIPADTTEIEIPLRLFNYNSETGKSAYSDEDTFAVSLQENSSIDKNNVTEYSYPTKWKWYIDSKQQSYIVDGSPTPTPKVTPTPKPTASPKATATPKPTSAPKPSDDTSGSSSDNEVKLTRRDTELKAGNYTVGTDIASGKYYVLGNGTLRTYDSEGSLTDNIDLAAEVAERGYYAVTLRNGESISLSEDAELKTTRPTTEGSEVASSTGVTPTPRVRATATPKASASRSTSSASAKSTPTPRPTATPAPKTNPKTGDAAPLTALSVLGILSLCAIVAIQLKKEHN